MKISVLADFHLGFAYNSEMENDSFENAEEAMNKALDSDLILVAGDIFDSRSPKPQEWAKALHILSKPLLKESTGISLITCTKELKKISRKTLSHLPVIAIHGNHERRSRDEVTAIEALENAGMLIHLHLQTIVIEKEGMKVAIHGMSSVPERFAKDVLNAWNPKPVEGCFNILLLHQSVDPYVYSDTEPPSIALTSLPPGFDLIIDGHLHAHAVDKTDKSPFLIVGSTISTQIQKSEAGIKKGFVRLDVGKELNIEFVPLEKSRKIFYEEIILGEQTIQAVIEQNIEKILSSEGFSKPPIIRMKIMGKESEVIDKELAEIEKKFSGKAVLIFAKELESEEVTEKMELLKSLREQRLSIEEIGLNILKKTLDELSFTPDFDYEKIFWLLSDGKTEEAFRLLTGDQTSLEILKR